MAEAPAGSFQEERVMWRSLLTALLSSALVFGAWGCSSETPEEKLAREWKEVAEKLDKQLKDAAKKRKEQQKKRKEQLETEKKAKK